MSAVLYDKALVAKIKKWTEGTQVQVYGPDETRRMFEIIADKTSDQPIKLPIICLRRNGYEILNTSKQPGTYDGFKTVYTGTGVAELNHIPINLSYQIDVYAKYYEEADAYMRELLFNLINAPIVDVLIPYMDTNLTHRSAIAVGTNIDDLSSIPERMIAGQFTRLGLAFTIPDAHLFDVRQKGYVSLQQSGLLIESSPEDIVKEDVDFRQIKEVNLKENS